MNWWAWRRRAWWAAIFFVTFPPLFLVGLVLAPPAVVHTWFSRAAWRLGQFSGWWAWPVFAIPALLTLVTWPVFLVREFCYAKALRLSRRLVWVWRVETSEVRRVSRFADRFRRAKRGRATR